MLKLLVIGTLFLNFSVVADSIDNEAQLEKEYKIASQKLFLGRLAAIKSIGSVSIKKAAEKLIASPDSYDAECLQEIETVTGIYSSFTHHRLKAKISFDGIDKTVTFSEPGNRLRFFDGKVKPWLTKDFYAIYQQHEIDGEYREIKFYPKNPEGTSFVASGFHRWDNSLTSSRVRTICPNVKN